MAARSHYGGPERRTYSRREPQRWHVGKEIPLVLVCALLLQTAGGIWWLAQLSSKIDAAVATIAEFKTERYTREDARRDRELADQKLQALQAVDHDIDRRMNGAEGRIDRLESARREKP